MILLVPSEQVLDVSMYLFTSASVDGTGVTPVLW